MPIEAQRWQETLVNGIESCEIVDHSRDADASSNLVVERLELAVTERKLGEVVIVQWIGAARPRLGQSALGERSKRREP